jgi:hypothetical protein
MMLQTGTHGPSCAQSAPQAGPNEATPHVLWGACMYVLCMERCVVLCVISIGGDVCGVTEVIRVQYMALNSVCDIW